MFRADNNEIVDVDTDRAYKTVLNLFNLSKNNKFKNLTRLPNIGAIKEPIFLSLNTKKALNYLKQAFIKASIF